LWSSFGEQLWKAGAALHGSFERKLWKTAALEQLWGLALECNFEGAAFGSNFAEQLSRAALENSQQVWNITALAAAGNRFGE
jgi:hypothetical protein